MNRFENLMSEASGLEYGDAKVSILEECVCVADVLQDQDAGIKARMALIQAGTFGGFDDKALVAFSWCLPLFDAEPERFPNWDFLWMSKWILGAINQNPANSLATIDRLFRDVERRFEEHDYSLRPILSLRASLASNAGLNDAAMRFLAKWKSSPKDALANCPACELGNEFAVYANVGLLQESIELAKPLLQGTLKCDVQPTATFGTILEPLLRLHRYEEAREHNRKGQRRASGKRHYLSTTSQHLRFRTHLRDFAGAVRILESNMRFGLETSSWSDKFEFLFSAAILFEALIRHRTRQQRKMRLPRNFDLWNDADQYDLTELHAWFQKNTIDIAVRFDQRNGTTRYADRIDSVSELILSDPPG